MFVFQEFGIVPDIVAVAKPLAAGLPLGAFIVKEGLASAMSAGRHGTTFGGGPLACRVSLEYFAVLEEQNLLEQVRRVGAYLAAELDAIKQKFPAVVERRGRGLIQALELDIPARPLVEAALVKGILFNSTQDVVLRFLPPFLIEEKHVDRGMRLLRALLRKAKPAKAAPAQTSAAD
jgi:acetylornithine/succinyldiaminopimelate/putrescine aminotransferase